jgi:formamidopyrimidine-DNA glycosylase
MPELPEVETVARELREGKASRGPSVVGRTIESVTVRWPRHIAHPAPAEVQRRLPGQQVLDVSRRAKFVVFALSQDVMLIHLKMSGDLNVVAGDTPLDKHDHTLIRFADGFELRFNDTRKFGKVWVGPSVEALTGPLGPEPLDPAFTAEQFAAMLKARRRLLKPLLLDQTFLAGVGNIYADESLHIAGLHPLRRSDTLRPHEARALHAAIRQALAAGLAHNGASIDWLYKGGEFQHYLSAYGREGQPCLKPGCNGAIKRILVGQRSTHFCPKCQRRR